MTKKRDYFSPQITIYAISGSDVICINVASEGDEEFHGDAKGNGSGSSSSMWEYMDDED